MQAALFRVRQAMIHLEIRQTIFRLVINTQAENSTISRDYNSVGRDGMTGILADSSPKTRLVFVGMT